MSERDDLKNYFVRFWKNEAIGAGSPLYAALCDVVVSDEWLLDLAANARPGQPAPNMLFAAVHALVEQHPREPLAQYYLSVGGTREPDEALGLAFPAFCHRFEEPIVEMLRTRLVQTNEVRRSAFLLPAFSFAWRETGQALALVEIGPSAGLNLLFDRYRYRYGDEVDVGDADSPVVLDAEVRGHIRAEAVEVPPVVFRAGIDINPLDVRDEDDATWLRALVWPEHDDRRALLTAAMGVARDADLDLRKGDAVELLPRVMAEVPKDTLPCLYATFVLHQLPAERRAALRSTLLRLSRELRFVLIVAGYSEFFGQEQHQPDGSTFVKLGWFEGGRCRYRSLVHCHPHGRWLELQEKQEWLEME